MQRMVTFSLVLTLLGIVGCGKTEKLLPTHGRLLKGGEPFVGGPDELLQVTFVPIEANGQPPKESYFAQVDDAKATFVAFGKKGNGVPPGKYRIAIELMKKRKDMFKGKYDFNKSPYIFDIDSNTKEIVIDLDNPTTG